LTLGWAKKSGFSFVKPLLFHRFSGFSAHEAALIAILLEGLTDMPGCLSFV
jgi:hypothetical protein